MFTKIPPAAAGGLFIPKLPRTRKILRNPTGGSRWIVHSQATEDTKDSPQSHRRQPVDRSVPTFVSRYWTRAEIERSTGCRRWDSREFLAPCRLGLNDPPAAAGGIPESQNLCRNISWTVCALH